MFQALVEWKVHMTMGIDSILKKLGPGKMVKSETVVSGCFHFPEFKDLTG